MADTDDSSEVDYEHEIMPSRSKLRRKRLGRFTRFAIGTGLTIATMLANRDSINSQAYDQLPPDNQVALKWGAEQIKQSDSENKFKQVTMEELAWVLATDPELVAKIVERHKIIVRIQEIEKTYGIRSGFADTDISAEPALYNELNSPIR